jgi:hypothetical protein
MRRKPTTRHHTASRGSAASVVRQTVTPLLLSVALLLAMPAAAQLTMGWSSPTISIGINLSSFPSMSIMPGYPVYYAPQLKANYFFYDGLYWVFEADSWYSSAWYNGPWHTVDPMVVPPQVLRIPVRYYRQAPAFFRGWAPNSAPRWGEHWGGEWAQRRGGWERREAGPAPARAPLPTYQRQYPGNRYPPLQKQGELHERNYRYQPHDPMVRDQSPPGRSGREGPGDKGPDRSQEHGPDRKR